MTIRVRRTLACATVALGLMAVPMAANANGAVPTLRNCADFAAAAHRGYRMTEYSHKSDHCISRVQVFLNDSLGMAGWLRFDARAWPLIVGEGGYYTDQTKRALYHWKRVMRQSGRRVAGPQHGRVISPSQLSVMAADCETVNRIHDLRAC